MEEGFPSGALLQMEASTPIRGLVKAQGSMTLNIKEEDQQDLKSRDSAHWKIRATGQVRGLHSSL